MARTQASSAQTSTHWSWTASLAAVLTAAGVTGLLALFGDNSWLERSATAAQIEDARAEVAHLVQEQQELQERLANLMDGTLEMERIARERLGLARAGEMIYRFDR